MLVEILAKEENVRTEELIVVIEGKSKDKKCKENNVADQPQD